MDLQRGIGIVLVIAGAGLFVVPKFAGPALGGWRVAVAIATFAIGALIVVQSASAR